MELHLREVDVRVLDESCAEVEAEVGDRDGEHGAGDREEDLVSGSRPGRATRRCWCGGSGPCCAGAA